MNPNPVDLKKSEEYRRIHERLTLSPTRKPTTITRDRDLGYRDDLDVLSEHAALASKKREEGGDLTENEDDIIETTNEKISQRSIERSAVKSTLKPVFGGVRRVGNEILKKMEQIRSITNELETETAAHKITQKRKDDLHAELLAAEKFIEQKNVEIKLLKSMLEATKNTSSLPAQTMVAIGVDNIKSSLDETGDRVSEMESKIKQQLQKFKPATVAETEQPAVQQTEPTQNNELEELKKIHNRLQDILTPAWNEYKRLSQKDIKDISGDQISRLQNSTTKAEQDAKNLVDEFLSGNFSDKAKTTLKSIYNKQTDKSRRTFVSYIEEINNWIKVKAGELEQNKIKTSSVTAADLRAARSGVPSGPTTHKPVEFEHLIGLKLGESKYKRGTKGVWSINGTDIPITLSGKQVVLEDGSIMFVTLTENGNYGAAIYEKDFSVSAEPLVNETKPNTRKQERVAEVEERKRSEALAEAKSVAQVAANQIAILKQSSKNSTEFAQNWAARAIEKIESLDIDESDRLKLIQQIKDALGTKKKPEPKDKVYGDAKERKERSAKAAKKFEESKTEAGKKKKAEEEEAKKSKEMQRNAGIGLAAMAVGASLALGATYAKQDTKPAEGLENTYPIAAKRLEGEREKQIEKIGAITVDKKLNTVSIGTETLLLQSLEKFDKYYLGIEKVGDTKRYIIIPSEQVQTQLKVAKTEEEKVIILSGVADEILSRNPNMPGCSILTGELVKKDVNGVAVTGMRTCSFKNDKLAGIVEARHRDVEVKQNPVAKEIFGNRYAEYVRSIQNLTLKQFISLTSDEIIGIEDEVSKLGDALKKKYYNEENRSWNAEAGNKKIGDIL